MAIIKQVKFDIKKLQRNFNKVDAAKLELAEKLQPFVEFEIYISIFESDGVCVMHGGKNVGMSASTFVSFLEKGAITEDVFLNNANY